VALNRYVRGAGTEWLQANFGRRKPLAISPLGEVVADILNTMWQGLYHMDPRPLELAEWGNPRNIKVRITNGHELATYDSSHLTGLVVLCHDARIRLAIQPAMRDLRLWFSQRRRDPQSVMEGLPPLESMAEYYRSALDLRPDDERPSVA
jgi:hypothetical protein